MDPPRFVVEEMLDHEVSLAEVRRAYNRLRMAPAAEREAAQRAYDLALQRARAIGARLARELHATQGN